MTPSAAQTLGVTIASAFGIQAAFASVAIPLQTEKFYDLSGSLTFGACTLLSLYYPALRARTPLPAIWSFHPRQLIMSGFTVLWAGRLGTFLYNRIARSGSDTRFDQIKLSPTSFAGAWLAQAVWISTTALPVFIVNSIPRASQAPLGKRDLLGVAMWLGAFAYEVRADREKSKWREGRSKKDHDEKFISSGLWAQSRHPNYVGEVMLWSAQYVIATSALTSPLVAGPLFPAWLAVAAIGSPLAEYALIRYVSGVPLLEKSAEEKFGNDPKWIEYKKNTPVFFPKLF